MTRPNGWALLGLLVLGLVVFAACGGDDDPEVTAEPEASEPAADEPTTSSDDSTVELDPEETELVSFSQDVQPLITATCARCHTGDGPGTAISCVKTFRSWACPLPRWYRTTSLLRAHAS